MRGTKKYKIVKCFRHFGAIIILLWLISIVRFPYSFDKLQVLSNKNFETSITKLAEIGRIIGGLIKANPNIKNEQSNNSRNNMQSNI